jgi:UDP-N-acetylglucosamine 2-epimerase (non-hydrolysing)
MTAPILTIVGARPNFMKAAPVHLAFERRGVTHLIIHTGQHYDDAMSQVFFDDLGMPRPAEYLGVGSASHAVQTANIMIGLEKVFLERKPRMVIVVGDVNSTMAAALVASKLLIPVAHVEAGLRSRDWTMPEEVNRAVTDVLSNLLLTPSPDADANLLAEGREPSRIVRVGNVMIDTLFMHLDRARALDMRVRSTCLRGCYSSRNRTRCSRCIDLRTSTTKPRFHGSSTRSSIFSASCRSFFRCIRGRARACRHLRSVRGSRRRPTSRCSIRSATSSSCR